jgi:DNA-binding transcriptional LysR family regulator
VHAVRGTGYGAVTLALVGTLASSALARRLREFREAYPALDARLPTALSAEVSALGLRYGPDPHPGLVSAIVNQERLVPGLLEEYAARFDDLFGRLAQRRGFREYLAGLLAPRDRNKTLTALAGAEPVTGPGHPAAQRLQFFCRSPGGTLTR